MSNTIQQNREAAGISQSELARRLGVTPSAVAQMEQSERDETIQLRTLRNALEVLGRDLSIETMPTVSRLPQYAPFKVAEVIADELRKGDTTYALRYLAEAVSTLKDGLERRDLTEADLRRPPEKLPDEAWDVLMRAMYAQVISGRKPSWTQAKPLPQPVYISKYNSVRRKADRSTPDYLRRLNILVDHASIRNA